jgi:hypothetical protein
MENTLSAKKKVETIFDYHPTVNELEMFGLSPWYRDYQEKVQRRKQWMEEAEEPNYLYLGRLFDSRGDTERAAEYYAKAPAWQQETLISCLDCKSWSKLGSVY